MPVLLLSKCCMLPHCCGVYYKILQNLKLSIAAPILSGYSNFVTLQFKGTLKGPGPILISKAPRIMEPSSQPLPNPYRSPSPTITALTRSQGDFNSRRLRHRVFLESGSRIDGFTVLC